MYLYKLQAIRKNETTLNVITRQVEARDMNQALKSYYEILTGLKYIFLMPNQPDYMKESELCLSANTVEEYKYPLGKEWNLLINCVKAYK